ncbi:hypothetical protein HZU73_00620 [Apis mellifera caucasica]|nr:hypothetical protein HZU73_00620 [Apis mellifera caucasica]
MLSDTFEFLLKILKCTHVVDIIQGLRIKLANSVVKLLRTSFQSIIVVTFRVISLRSCIKCSNLFPLSLETRRKSSKIKDSSVHTSVTLMQFYRCRGGETKYEQEVEVKKEQQVEGVEGRKTLQNFEFER